jgi:hypothetical protein
MSAGYHLAKWIDFREAPAPGVTKRWEVVAKQGGVIIGRVSWSTGWRKYVLQPGYPTEWEQDCLRDVAAFLEGQTAARKAERLARV